MNARIVGGVLLAVGLLLLASSPSLADDSIQQLLAGNVAGGSGDRSVNEGAIGDGVPDLLVFTLPGSPLLVDPAKGVRINPDGKEMTGYLIQSAGSLFTGEPTQHPFGMFQEDFDYRISGGILMAPLTSLWNLGAIIGQEWYSHIIDAPRPERGLAFLGADLTFFYNARNTPGTPQGTLIFVPEPGTVVLLITAALGLLICWRRRS